MYLVQHVYKHPNDRKRVDHVVETCPSEIKGDIGAMFAYIDEKLLGGKLFSELKRMAISVKFDHCIDDDTEISGVTTFSTRRLQILLCVNMCLIGSVFRDNISDPAFIAGGRVCRSKHQCSMYTLFHEICHVILLLYAHEHGPNVNLDSHGALFRSVNKRAFAQTAYKHCIKPGFHAYADTDQIHDDLRHTNRVYLFDNGVWEGPLILEEFNTDVAVIHQRGEQFEVPLGLLRPFPFPT